MLTNDQLYEIARLAFSGAYVGGSRISQPAGFEAAVREIAKALRDEAKQIHAMSIPDGYEMVNDEKGRATGSLRRKDDDFERISRAINGELEFDDPFVVRELREKADLYLERNKLYGDNYKRFGKILSLLLEGQTLDAADTVQMNRLGVFIQVAGKLVRYGENFVSGGHDDSLDDLAVYAMMMKELDHDAKA